MFETTALFSILGQLNPGSCLWEASGQMLKSMTKASI